LNIIRDEFSSLIG